MEIKKKIDVKSVYVNNNLYQSTLTNGKKTRKD